MAIPISPPGKATDIAGPTPPPGYGKNLIPRRSCDPSHAQNQPHVADSPSRLLVNPTGISCWLYSAGQACPPVSTKEQVWAREAEQGGLGQRHLSPGSHNTSRIRRGVRDHGAPVSVSIMPLFTDTVRHQRAAEPINSNRWRSRLRLHCER